MMAFIFTGIRLLTLKGIIYGLLTICFIFTSTENTFSQPNIRQLLNSVNKKVLSIKEGSYLLHDNQTVLNEGEDTTSKSYRTIYHFRKSDNETLVGYLINSLQPGGEQKIYNGHTLYTLYSNTLTTVDAEKYPFKIRKLKNNISDYPIFIMANNHLQYYNNDSSISQLKYNGIQKFNGINYWKFQVGSGDSTNNRNEGYYYISQKTLLPERIVTVFKYVTAKARQRLIIDYSISDFKTTAQPDEIFKIDYLKYNKVVIYDSTKENIVTVSSLLKNGEKAPDWTLPIIQGDSISLSSLKNKIVVLDFWYKACLPCQHQMNSLQSLHEKYQNKNVVFVGINLYDDPVKEKLQLYLKNRNISMRSAYKGDLIKNLYKVDGAPILYIIDKNGKIIYSLEGYSDTLITDLSNIIEKELNNF